MFSPHQPNPLGKQLVFESKNNCRKLVTHYPLFRIDLDIPIFRLSYQTYSILKPVTNFSDEFSTGFLFTFTNRIHSFP